MAVWCVMIGTIVAGFFILQATSASSPSASAIGSGSAATEAEWNSRSESASMVHIPGGAFLMGSPDGVGWDNEHPQHPVTVAAFEMDTTEVTVAAYSACVQSGQCTAPSTDQSPDHLVGAPRLCNFGKGDKSNHPINCVGWGQAATYCNAHGQRLPTEEEWEYAARGGQEEREYSWGSAPPDFQLCWSGISKRNGTCAVGNFARGAFGLADMSGNVWEWTASGHSKDYSKKRVDLERTYRGGSFAETRSSEVRAAARYGFKPQDQGEYLGFRCVR